MICNAPFNNIYLTLEGKVSPCWKLTDYCDQWSEDRSIMDIWNGDKFKKYRSALKKDIFLERCKECKQDIDNDVWPLARAYNEYPVNDFWPSMMELELSNQCNLECIMCNGTLSSGIRKNRDKLPPLPMVYTDKFVEQLNEFIPHLTEIRFNGGEPLAQKIILDICENISRINPELKINIATNGTVYNKRVKGLLERCNIHLNISIDSLIKEQYEKIRINGDFDVLMKNFEIFKKYCHDNNREICIMVNPMRNNWGEMVNFALWCDEHNVSLWFNTILYPAHLALFNLPSKELTKIIKQLKKDLEKAYLINFNSFLSKNFDKVNHLINNQIENWLWENLENGL